MNSFFKFIVVSILLLSFSACDRTPQGHRDIRAPIVGQSILTKDLTGEVQVPSMELNQTIEATTQNTGAMMRIIVKKGSPLVSEVERQVITRNLQSRVQLVEK
ncbi:hypothetical protein [Undibacterium sp. Di27W]|uniref:hypothetical protein n=1 Tax=Undibacterium sp. Di27W TaxID=3413036 RepID=UPI003BF5157E